MKIALLLLTCLVGVSRQQVYGQWPDGYVQRSFFYPVGYGSNQLVDPFSFERGNSDEVGLIQSRAPLRLSHPQQRFFFGLLAPNSMMTATLYVFSTATSTVTSATFLTCIPNEYFSEGAMDKQCRRKKRSHAELLDEITEAISRDETIAPSKIIPIVASEEVKKRDFYPEIASSRDDAASPNQLNGLSDRQLRSLVATVTSTSTVTSYTFTMTTITKQLTIAAKSGYTCSPSGIPIC